MRVIGKSTVIDRARARLEELPLDEQKQYYFNRESWLAYIVTCYKLGELTLEETKLWKIKAMKGQLK